LVLTTSLLVVEVSRGNRIAPTLIQKEKKKKKKKNMLVNTSIDRTKDKGSHLTKKLTTTNPTRKNFPTE